MMSIMDKLTDKEDWEKKVFDDEIVSKWRREALAMPDESFWKLAIGDKRQWWDENGTLDTKDDWGARHDPLEGVINDTTFDYVGSI